MDQDFCLGIAQRIDAAWQVFAGEQGDFEALGGMSDYAKMKDDPRWKAASRKVQSSLKYLVALWRELDECRGPGD